MTKIAFLIVFSVTACLYAVLYAAFGISGSTLFLAIVLFPVVLFVAAFLSALLVPGLFDTESNSSEEPEDDISVIGTVSIVGEGPSLGSLNGEPIHEYFDVCSEDGITRRFEYSRVSENEKFDVAPADRWIVVNNMLYIFNHSRLKSDRT